MKIVKYTLIGLGSLIVLVLLALILVPVLFKGKILNMAQQTINDNVNAKVQFEDFDLSMFRSFPNLNVEMQKLTVTGIDTFANDTLVAFDKFSVDVDVMSALSQKIKVRSIILDKPVINIIKLPNGQVNYDIAKPDTSTAVAEETPDTDTASSAPYTLKLKEFVINNAQISYRDDSSKMSARINDLSYLLKGDLGADFSSIENNLKIQTLTFTMDGVKYLNKAAINFDALIDADLKNMKFTFKENVFKLNDVELAFEGTVDMPAADITTDIKFGLKNTSFKSLLSLVPVIYMQDFAGLETSGSLAFTGFAKGIYNDKSYPLFGVDLQVKNGMFKYPDLPKSVENVNVNVKVANSNNSIDYMNIDISTFHMDMAGNPFDVTMGVAMTPADMNVKGNFDGTLDLNSVKDVVPMTDFKLQGTVVTDVTINGNLSSIEQEKYEDFMADGIVKITDFYFENVDLPQGFKILQSELNFTPRYLEVRSFDAKVGRSDMSLQGNVSNYIGYALRDDVLKGAFNFQSNYFDVNEFMTGEAAPDTAAVTPTEADTAAMTVIEIPKNIDFELQSNLQRIRYDKLDITNTQGLIVVRDGVADMRNLSMNLLGGNMIMNGAYDSRDAGKPVSKFAIALQNINIASAYKSFSILQQMAPIAKFCAGKITTSFDLNCFLDKEMMPVMGSLNADGSLHSDNIGLSGAKSIDAMADKLGVDQMKNLVLQNISAIFKIINGELHIDPPLTVNMQNIGTTAAIGGTQKLDKSIDYKIDLTLPQNLIGGVMGKLGSMVPSGIGTPNQLKVSVFMGGTVDNPTIKNVALGDNAVTDIVKDVVNDAVDKVKDKLNDKAQQIILEGDQQAQKVIDEAERQGQVLRDEAKQLGDKGVAEAQKQGDDLVKKAGSNIIAKKAAEKTRDELVKQARKKADDLNNEADKKAKQLVDLARQKADQIKQEAQNKANNL